MGVDIKLRHRSSVLKSEQGLALVIVIMVVALLLCIMAAGLVSTSTDLKITGRYKVGNQAFYAADTGVQVGVSQITGSTDPNPVTFNGIVDTIPFSGQTKFVGTNPMPGFSLGSGTGYNPSGYDFYQYQINVTGTVNAPDGTTQLAARQVEAQAQYGPVPE